MNSNTIFALSSFQCCLIYLSAKQTWRSKCYLLVSLSVSRNVENKRWLCVTWWQDDPNDQNDRMTRMTRMTQMTGSFADNWLYGIFNTISLFSVSMQLQLLILFPIWMFNPNYSKFYKLPMSSGHCYQPSSKQQSIMQLKMTKTE